jgi:ferredoxin
MQDVLAWPRQWLRRRAADNSDVGTVAAATVGTHPQPSPRLDEPAVPRSPSGLARRTLLAAGLGAAGGVALRAARGSAEPPPALRPPGAIDWSRFTGVCVRCGNCVRACPARIIRPDLGGHGLAGLLAPELTFEEDYCREDCRACTEVCPSGAISRLAMEEKRRFVIGLARVDLKICILSKGEECTVCTRACSYEAISTPRSADGSALEPRVDLARCVGCGSCEVMCPTEPAKAVRVYPAAPVS